MATTAKTAEPAASSTDESTDEAIAEALPAIIRVKNISKVKIPLDSGVLDLDKEGDARKYEYENLVGTYLEKV